MVKFLKKGRVVVILQGKYAGCKGVIIENHEATKKHPFGHAVIAGVSSPPKRVTRAMNRTQLRKRTKIGTFVKVVNHKHLMPTRYRFRSQLPANIDKKKLDPKEGKRRKLRNRLRSSFSKAYMRDGDPQTRWFFRKLYF